MLFYLLVCCLLIGQIEIAIAKNIATTDKPLISSVDVDQLLNIQTKLIRIQDDIISITASMVIAENMENIDSKVEATEAKFKLIKKDLANELLQQTDDECRGHSKTLVNNQYNAVGVQLEHLRSSLKEYTKRRLPSDAIADIIGLRFESAEEKLEQINDFVEIKKIVQAVYGNRPDGFNVLANLIEILTDIDLKDMFVRALQQEMAKNEHKNPFKWIRLAKILQKEVINKPNVEFFTKTFASFTYDGLKDSISNFTIEALNDSVKKGEFDRNLTTAVYLFDPFLSESIIEKFVNANYGLISSKKILKIIESHELIQQRVMGVNTLFSKIKNAQNLNSEVTINIASVLKTLRTDSEFEKLNKTQRDGMDQIIENLPACARNLFFLPSVCFWNKGKEEYLTAGSLNFKYDNSRRNIFSADPLPESHWYVNRTGENFLFSSRTYENEYLYAAAFNFNEDLRYVFNWLPGHNTDKQSEWSIELDGDYCYIKSAMYDEYLFSSSNKRPEGNNLRYVFTWVPGHSVREPQFQWQIRKCN